MKKQVTIYSFKERMPKHGEHLLVFHIADGFTEPERKQVNYPSVADPKIYKDDFFRVTGTGRITNVEKDFYMISSDFEEMLSSDVGDQRSTTSA